MAAWQSDAGLQTAFIERGYTRGLRHNTLPFSRAAMHVPPPMDPTTLLILFAVGLLAGFVDSIAGGGGMATLPALQLAGLDPVGAVATNKLAGTFGSGSATFAFWRAGRIDFTRMGPSALLALAGSVLGALALPYAPRALLVAAIPLLLIVVAAYFAFSPKLTSPGGAGGTPRPLALLAAHGLIGFYDGVFGPGAGSFYMIALLRLGRAELVDALAGARLANFGSNIGSLTVYALGGHIVVMAGLAMGTGNFIGAHIGAHTALKAGARVIRPLVVVIALALAVKLLSQADAPWRTWLP